ncbi:MAG: SPOR domain-containing protein [Tepidisphaeraceae bacterium]
MLSAELVLSAGLAGCKAKGDPAFSGSGKPKSKQDTRLLLGEGYRALEQKEFNQAISKADQILSSYSQREGSAEALYLKGRSFEGKNAAGVTADEAKANLQSAREAYIAALQKNPSQPLQSYLQASLGNVAYFQDDYSTALGQFRAAQDKIESPDLKGWLLYRVGLCQQRVGQFDEADKTFAEVAKVYPDTEPARRAREHAGARAFHVQFATFASAQSAQAAATQLRAQGLPATTVPGPQGRAFLRVGPVSSYAQAQYYKTRFAEKYPDALIVP